MVNSERVILFFNEDRLARLAIVDSKAIAGEVEALEKPLSRVV